MGVIAAYPLVSAMVAATAASAYSAYSSGQQQKAMGDYQADQAAADAEAEMGAAKVQADRIRRMGQVQSSQATAALAASGVSVAEGTAIDINKEIAQNAEEDATMTIINARSGAARLNAQGQAASIQGGQAATAGYLNAGSSLLAGGASAYKGWKLSANGSTPTVGGKT